jgi:hypothetical protein
MHAFRGSSRKGVQRHQIDAEFTGLLLKELCIGTCGEADDAELIGPAPDDIEPVEPRTTIFFIYCSTCKTK